MRDTGRQGTFRPGLRHREAWGIRCKCTPTAHLQQWGGKAGQDDKCPGGSAVSTSVGTAAALLSLHQFRELFQGIASLIPSPHLAPSSFITHSPIHPPGSASEPCPWHNHRMHQTRPSQARGVEIARGGDILNGRGLQSLHDVGPCLFLALCSNHLLSYAGVSPSSYSPCFPQTSSSDRPRHCSAA